jgi:hypothetical protein
MLKRLALGVMTAILMTPAVHAASTEAAGNMPWERFTQAALDALCAHIGICLIAIP